MAKILIVEDEHIVAKDIEHSLKKLGYDVCAMVSTGISAIKKSFETKPDMVLMDILLKGDMDGIEAAEKIKSNFNIPIVYLTAYADEKTLERAKITEPFGYIIKPFKEKELHSVIEMGLYKNKTEKEKEALKEKIIRLTKKIPLTENEKLVLYGVVKYPLLNDIELSRKLKIKRSTITSIKNKLKRENYYQTYRIPDFHSIGCELLTLIYGNLNPSKDKAAKLGMIKETISAPEQIYINATNKEIFGICISKNLTDFRKHINRIISAYKEAGLSDSMTQVYFPFEISSLKNLFDYSSYLKKLMELDMKEEPQKIIEPKRRRLTNNEKIILYALVKFPDLNDSEIAEKTKLPRPSISQTRRKLLKEGFLKVVNIPYLLQIRSELLVLNHIKFDASNKIEAIRDCMAGMHSSSFFISADNEVCAINLYNDYTEYEIERNKEIKFRNENRFSTLANHIYPVPQILFEKFSFAPLVRKTLDLKVDF